MGFISTLSAGELLALSFLITITTVAFATVVVELFRKRPIITPHYTYCGCCHQHLRTSEVCTHEANCEKPTTGELRHD